MSSCRCSGGSAQYSLHVAFNTSPYYLTAVIEHVTSNPSRPLESGHYVCACRDGHGDRDPWRRYDDGRVTRVSEDEVLAMQAYLLFYVRDAREDPEAVVAWDEARRVELLAQDVPAMEILGSQEEAGGAD